MTLSHDRSRVVAAIAVFTAALMATLVSAGAAEAASPPTVLLGTAAQYAVLAGSGMTNTGVTTINGDVGSTPTPSQTGFAPCPAADCVALTGTNHNDPAPNDAVTQAAKVALATAYDDAAGRTPTEIITELAGRTLVAGVYDSASGTFGLTGPPPLVLDGENNADAVFIFQTDTTLITGAGAAAGNITLIRGAQACNVFWKVGSSATLGAGTSFKGTILAFASISVGAGVTVEGRLLAARQGNAGAVTMINDTITKPSTCASQSAIDAATAQAAAAKAAADKADADQRAAAVAATNAANAAAEAARQAQYAKNAADEAAAAKAAAEKAAEAANVEAARVAAANAAEAARVAAATAEAAATAAATAAAAARQAAALAAAAKVATAKAAATKAAAAARAAAAQAKVAKAAAVKAKAAAKAARAKVAAAKKRKAAGSSSFARPARRNVGLTG